MRQTRGKPAARLLRWGYMALGMLMVALGVIGALLPVMPTTIFLILALACFSRASPRLEQRLLQHPRYGASLRLWREHRAVSRRGKRMACLGIAIGFIAMCLGHPPLAVVVLVGVAELLLALYLLRRPEGPSTARAAPAIPAILTGASAHTHARAISRPLAAAAIAAAHAALLAWILYGHAQATQHAAIEPQAERNVMLLYLPAAAPPKPVERRQAERVNPDSAPKQQPTLPPRETPAPQPPAPQAAAPLPTAAEAPPAAAPASSTPRSAAPSSAATQAAAPPSPALPPAQQEVLSGSSGWAGKVLARMERFRRYPTAARARGEQGVVTLRCRVNREGQVLSAAIEHGSGFPALDQAALETLQRAAPLPRVPDERPAPLELSIPVRFSVG